MSSQIEKLEKNKKKKKKARENGKGKKESKSNLTKCAQSWFYGDLFYKRRFVQMKEKRRMFSKACKLLP